MFGIIIYFLSYLHLKLVRRYQFILGSRLTIMAAMVHFPFRNVLQKVNLSGFVYRQWFSTSSTCLSKSSFKFSDLQITLTKEKKPKPEWDKLMFGKTFSDHMLSINWNESSGWSAPKIHPLDNFSLHPASKVLHYATEVFEGLKGYYGVDGKIRIFRPDMNMKRLNASAKRICLPAFDEHELLKCLVKLMSIEREWVPNAKDSSIYIRPTFIATEPSLGVNYSNSALLYIILSPVGSYFASGTFCPVTLLADPQYVRAWPGGIGACKSGANYGPTIYIQKTSESKGCQQVLWLFGDDHQVTEAGTMNLFMLWTNPQGEKELITPPLNGLILPGVTRQSILDLGRQWNEFKISEKEFTMKDVVKGVNENRIEEMFGAGTACIVCPIGKILYQNQMLELPSKCLQDTSVTVRFLKTLTGIQYGRIPDKNNWMQIVE